MASVPRKSGSQTGCITLMQPRMTTVGLEALLRELKHVFSGVGGLGECLAIPTNQHAELDLVNIGDKVEKEKDRLLNTFVTFASSVCEKIRQEGYWADYIDPCSGLPMLSGGNKVYSEVEGMQLLLQYQVMNAGTCKVLLHPRWGSSVYPASLFSTAPVSAIQQLLDEHWSSNPAVEK